jgi:hypothetical protein
MRLVHATACAVAALLLASAASAQGIGDAAAKEKQKRKAAPAKPAKVYTEKDVGSSMAPVSTTVDLPATAADAKAKTDAGGAPATDADKAEKEAAEAHAKAEADWHKRLDQARKEESAYQEMINKIQLALNDTSSLYSPGRAGNVALMDENKQKLAEVQARIATLEAEGRSNNYR